MFWFIKELVERAITFFIRLSKGGTPLEKLTSAFKTLLMFTTFVIMVNFWILSKYVNVAYEMTTILETPRVENTVELVNINEELARQLTIARRENRVLIHNAITINFENNWLRSRLESTLEELEEAKENNNIFRLVCIKTKP